MYAFEHNIEFKNITNAYFALTVSFARPFARRFARTLRPVGDFMRMRKPCVFARLRLFG